MKHLGIAFLALAYLVFASAAPAANVGPRRALLNSGQPPTFTVDSNRGSSTCNGSPSCPFSTLSQLPATLNNATICLAAGSYWRELYNPSGVGNSNTSTNVKIKACGQGAAPVLDASDIIPANTWTLVGGLVSTYQSPNLRGPASDGVGVPVVIVFEDGNPLGYKTTTALVDATAGTYTVSSHTTNTITVYVHATSGTPDTNGKTYEYTSRAGTLILNCVRNCVVDGGSTSINFKRAGTTLGSLQILGDGSLPIVSNVTCTQGGRHCIGIPAGTVQNSTFNNAYDPSFDGTLSQLVFFEGTGSGKPSYSINNTFNFGSDMTAVTAATMSVGTAGTAHTGSGGTLGTINYINNDINVSGGFSFGGLSAGVGSVVVNITGGTWLQTIAPIVAPSTGKTTNVTNVRMKTSALSSTYFANLNGGGQLNITNVNICLSNINQAMMRHTDTSATNVAITNSTFYAQVAQIGAAQVLVDFGGNLTWSFNNSILDLTNSGPYAFGSTATGETYASSDNNHFIGNTRYGLNNVTYIGLPAWQAQVTPSDLNSVTTGSGASACN